MTKNEIYQKQYNLAKIKIDEGFKDAVDKVQDVADWAAIGASLIPGGNLVGSAIDYASSLVDVAQGDYGDAAWRAGAGTIGLIPGGRIAASATRGIAKGAVKAAEIARGAAKLAPEIKAVAHAAPEVVAKAATTGEKAAAAAAKAAPETAEVARVAGQIPVRSAERSAERAAKISAARDAALADRKAAGFASSELEALEKSVGKPAVETGKELATIGKVGTEAGKELATIERGLAKTGAEGAAKAGAKSGVKAGLKGAAIGAAGKIIYDALTRSSDGSSDGKIGDRDTVPVNRVAAGVDLSRLIGQENTIADYARSTRSGHNPIGQGDINFRHAHDNPFNPMWLIDPQMKRNLRQESVDYKPTLKYNPTNGLKHKVKTALEKYLRSSEGRPLNNHLNDIKNTLAN
jgi:uncharacterized protein (DUF2147 family)